MKVLHINNFNYLRGGSDKVFLNTSRLLEKAGHLSVIYSGASESNLPSKYHKYFPTTAETADPKISDFGRFLHNSQARKNLEELIKYHGPFDLAHLHVYHGRLTASILQPLKEAGIPIIHSLHEYKLACPVYTMERRGKTCSACLTGSTFNVIRHRCKSDSLRLSLAAFMEFWASRIQGDVRLIDRFICVSDFQRELMELAGIPKDRLRTLHNFVDGSSDGVEPLGETDGYLLYFGRIEKLKGIETLVNAVKRSGHILKIVGSGSWVEEMKGVIADGENIQYLGFSSGLELRRLIARAEAVIVPSEWFEPFGLTVIEAKAAGTPVIAADIGGISELIRDGVDGFLYRSGSAIGLSEALSRLSAADRRALSAAALLDARERFSPEVYLQQLLAVYAEVARL